MDAISKINLAEILPRLIEALFVGLLIGLERERKRKKGDLAFGGIRTTPLIAILGFLAAMIAEVTTIFVFIAIFVSFSILVAISYHRSADHGEPGATTELTFLIVFVLGALIYFNYMLISAVVAVIILIFLTFKPQFRNFAFNIQDEDVYATIKFAIITIIILPLLPDQTYDPFGVLNPRKIWYLVILIAGINFVGYILFKLVGAKKGILFLSILGGIASSTATTLSFTERSKSTPELSRNFAAGIVLASTIMFPRILVIIYLLNAELGETLLLPVAIIFVTGIVTALVMFNMKEEVKLDNINLSNPFRLLFAFKFGLIFTAILFISSLAQHYFGDSGIYISSFFSGFADVDAVALSLADLAEIKITLEVAFNGILIAFFSNTLVKAGIASIFGAREIRKYAIPGFLPIILSCGIALVI
ncbi:MAG: hypothetical protein SCALA702_19010 [Melioribacteraceae bacterium]|nr:MAG: hypothetical protein SCALA702_19010 [Melioribacteraceae bacterium]